MKSFLAKMHYYWKRLKKNRHPFKYTIGKLLVLTGLSPLFYIRRRDYSLRFYPTALSLSLWADPRQRINDTLFLRRYLRSGDIMIDVGANIGSIALAASAFVGERGKVYAFEANPRIYAYLKKNILINRRKNIIIHNYAVGEKQGVINFSDTKSDDMNRIVEDPKAVCIKMISLDSLLPQQEKIQLLKIDVEGYEKFVIQGARRILKNVDCILFEADEKHYKNYGYSFRQIHDVLHKQEFKVYGLSDDGNDLMPIDKNHKLINCCNLLAVKNKELVIKRLKGK
ncbi:MAG: FkbM family methyltransferase [Spirochaetales bacterium]|nr:FkbM family methyltransferase [Spirochaetales bacterium]